MSFSAVGPMRRAAGRDRSARSSVARSSGGLGRLLGDAVVCLGLGSAAATRGGAVAGLVLAAVSAPRALLLVGGAAAERFGARRIRAAADAVMVAYTVALAVAAYQLGTTVWLLVGAGSVVGLMDAFRRPAAGWAPGRRAVGTAARARRITGCRDQ